MEVVASIGGSFLLWALVGAAGEAEDATTRVCRVVVVYDALVPERVVV